MKHLFTSFGLLALAIMLAPSCQNQASEPAKETVAEVKAAPVAGSYVYFNMDRILMEYEFAVKETEAYKAKASATEDDLNKRQKNLERDMRQFQENYQKGLMTTAMAQQKQQEIENKGAAFQKLAQEKQTEMMEEQQVMMNRIADAIKTYLDKYNKEKGYAMIITNTGGMPVVVADSTLDITSEILKGLNEEYKKKSDK